MPHVFRSRDCPVCGVSFRPRSSKGRYCTTTCANQDRPRAAWPTCRIWPRTCDRCQAPYIAQTPKGRYCGKVCAYPYAPTGTSVAWTCSDCGATGTWVAQQGHRPKRCPACTKAGKDAARRQARRGSNRTDRKHRQRARHYGVPYQPIRPALIFNRDRWTCRLCLLPLAYVSAPHPQAPTLDCIIPLAAPGSPGFIPGNVQAAHFLCNSRKGSRIAA
jgi:hypothetical protein